MGMESAVRRIAFSVLLACTARFLLLLIAPVRSTAKGDGDR